MKPTAPLDYLTALVRESGLVELRHHDRGWWTTRWFDSARGLLEVAERLSATGNLYTSLHRPRPGCRSVASTDPITNGDVERFTRLFFDFDPVRPADTASTEEELAEAEERARGLAAHLRRYGWPEPALAMSGNGWHLHYRTALPNTPTTEATLRTLYNGLHRQFSDDVVFFDRSVRNAGRICALYGYTKRKGTASAERPHRTAAIWIPQEWRQVQPRHVETLAARYAAQAEQQRERRREQDRGGEFRHRGKGDYSTLDVVAWFTAHGLYRYPIEDHKHAVHCPWMGEHTTPTTRSDTLVYEADEGWPGFFCHHAHCVGRNIRDVIALLGDADRFCARRWQRQEVA